MPMSVAAIIVAAGSSSRLGRAKQLLIVDGEPMLQRAIRVARDAGASPVFVVLGAHREAIEQAVDFSHASIVFNPEWPEGIASSIRAGVRFLENNAPDATGALLMTCDQPRITPANLRTIIDTFQSQSAPAVTASSYAGVCGIPAIFPPVAYPDLLALRGDKGARSLFSAPPWPLIAVPLAGGDIDIDRPEDMEALK
jgi:molybdenum cofactor cytidylyltransferase